jgi:hypothetical protein
VPHFQLVTIGLGARELDTENDDPEMHFTMLGVKAV